MQALGRLGGTSLQCKCLGYAVPIYVVQCTHLTVQCNRVICEDMMHPYKGWCTVEALMEYNLVQYSAVW